MSQRLDPHPSHVPFGVRDFAIFWAFLIFYYPLFNPKLLLTYVAIKHDLG